MNPEKILILTYPRSGTNLLRYHLKHLGKKDEVCRHGLTPEAIPRHHKYRLILGVRDYKECYLRHNFQHYPQDQSADLNIITHRETAKPPWSLKVYLNNLELYHTWPKDKILIYYEDLITQPETEIKRLAAFFNVDCQDYLNNYAQHFQTSLQAYRSDSITQGKTIHHHKYKLTPQARQKFDLLMKVANQRMFSLYLQRYLEAPEPVSPSSGHTETPEH